MNSNNNFLKVIAGVSVIGCAFIVYNIFQDDELAPISNSGFKSAYEEKHKPDVVNEVEFHDQNAKYQHLLGEVNTRMTPTEVNRLLEAEREKTKVELEESLEDKIQRMIAEKAGSNAVTEPKTGQTIITYDKDEDTSIVDDINLFGSGQPVELALNVGDYTTNLEKTFGKETADKSTNISPLEVIDNYVGKSIDKTLIDGVQPTVKLPGSARPSGLTSLDGLDSNANEQTHTSRNSMVWIEPIDAQYVINSKTNEREMKLPEIVGQSPLKDVTAEGDQEGGKGEELKILPIPFATANVGAKFIDGRLLTSLIGLVPIGGEVKDPYPFTVKVSSKALATNGLSIRGLAGMEFYGYAKGDYTNSCVKGYVTGMTYTFADGTIQTITNRTNTLIGLDDTLGYLTDEEGSPCIAGTVSDDLAEYMSMKAATVGLATAGGAYADKQADVYTNLVDSTATSVITGSLGKYAAGEMVREGVTAAGEVIDDLYSEAFIAVTVPNTQIVNVHVTRQLNIDYDPLGRKLNYDYSNNAQSHYRSELD